MCILTDIVFKLNLSISHYSSQSNQPMVTIRRVENPSTSQPTVTISMKSDQQAVAQAAAARPGEDKLLYTLVNGEILRARDAPDHLIPQAKPMPKNMASNFNRAVGQAPGAVPQTRPSYTAAAAAPGGPLPPPQRAAAAPGKKTDFISPCCFRKQAGVYKIRVSYSSLFRKTKNSLRRLDVDYIGSCVISSRMNPREFLLTISSTSMCFSPVWVLSCLFKWPRCAKLLSQFVHLNGFSPVCVL